MPDIREYTKSKKNDTDVSFMKKLFVHRVTVFYRIIIIIIVLIALGVGAYIYFQNKVYTKYNVVSTAQRTDTATTTYYQYAEGILKCSNDGVSYTNYANKVLWNQTFEMVNPMVDICKEYVAIADKEGSKIFVFNTKGLQSQFNVTQPIEKLQVASQGVVYTMQNDGNSSLMKVYDKDGNEELVGGEHSMTTSGYPMDIATSDDGEKLAVSFLYVSSGIMKTNIAFFNFGSVGQNKEDNLVSGYPYDSSVFPSVQYVNDTTAVAFGDKKVVIYQGKQIPKVVKEIDVEDEIKSICYSSSYIGLVYENNDVGFKYRLEIYDLEGKKVLNFKFDQDYNNIVLNDKEFIIVGDMEFNVYRTTGVQKFHYVAQNALLNVIPEASINKYVIIDSENTSVINLKLN